MIKCCPDCGVAIIGSVPDPMSAHILIRCSNPECVCGKPPYHVYSLEELFKGQRVIQLQGPGPRAMELTRQRMVQQAMGQFGPGR